MIDWLKQRLSGSQKESTRFIELSEAIQEFWEDNFDDKFQDLTGLRSIYTMSESDLAKRISELGERFSPDYPSEYDKPLALAWRLYEIKRKDTSFLLENSLRRNFGDLDVTWEPIYALKSEAYGDSFILGIKLGDDEKDMYFQTSRGKLRVDLGKINDLEIDLDGFTIDAENIVYKTKPEHIVYAGLIFFLLLSSQVDVFCGSVVRQAHKTTILTYASYSVDSSQATVAGFVRSANKKTIKVYVFVQAFNTNSQPNIGTAFRTVNKQRIGAKYV